LTTAKGPELSRRLKWTLKARQRNPLRHKWRRELKAMRQFRPNVSCLDISTPYAVNKSLL
jgi:hypothetical protein